MRNIILLAAFSMVVFILALMAACAAPLPTPVPTVTHIPTATPDISATMDAWMAAIPTATAYPTSTPYPTATPRPTVTPYPTHKWGMPYSPISISNIPDARQWGRINKEPFILQACYAPAARISVSLFGTNYGARTATMFTFTDDGYFNDDSRKAVVTGFFPGADSISSGCYNLAVQFDKTDRFCQEKGGYASVGGPCYRISIFRLIGYQTYEKAR